MPLDILRCAAPCRNVPVTFTLDITSDMLAVLNIFLIFVFAAVSFRLVAGLRRESKVISEFGLSSGLMFWVMLFPLGPVLLLGAPLISLPLSTVAACACYVPSLLVARGQDRGLQRAGTDRVALARAVTERSFAAALAGLLYVVTVSVISFGAVSIKSVGEGGQPLEAPWNILGFATHRDGRCDA